MLVNRQKTHRILSLISTNRAAAVYVISLCAILILVEHPELFQKETIYNGYDNVVAKRILPYCAYDASPFSRGALNWYFVCFSYLTFDNARIIPFAISVGLIPMSFILVRSRTGNLAGMMVATALALTPSYLIFDTSAAYAQTWAILFLASLYYMGRDSRFGVGFLGLSLTAKAIPFAWVPFILYEISRSAESSPVKIVSYVGIYTLVGVAVMFSIFVGGSITYSGLIQEELTINTPQELLNWIITAWRWNYHLLIAIPILFGIFIKYRKKLDSRPFYWLLASTVSMLLIMEFMSEGYFPYRLIPNIVIILWCCAEVITKFINQKL